MSDTLEHASTERLPNSNSSMSAEDAEKTFFQLELKLYT